MYRRRGKTSRDRRKRRRFLSLREIKIYAETPVSGARDPAISPSRPRSFPRTICLFSSSAARYVTIKRTFTRIYIYILQLAVLMW